MRANRRTDTKPELALRRALHAAGHRYRKDYRLDLDGGKRVRPDIAFTARRVAVFVDGCFWHCCPQHGSKPAVNVGYWDPKLRRNVERDRAADTALAAAGWSVVRIWEHEALADAVAAVLAALASRQPSPAPPAAVLAALASRQPSPAPPAATVPPPHATVQGAAAAVPPPAAVSVLSSLQSPTRPETPACP
jgi:DNA mismatch endonuclease (patch repair protein)